MIEPKPYGVTQGGQVVRQYTLQNANGLRLCCIDYGCRITNLWVPGADGEAADVILGYDALADYEKDTSSYQGAFIGRYANRIQNASFILNGKTYKLLQNDGQNYLHGSFASRVWGAEQLGDNSVSFAYTSPDGEDGFPGEVWVGVTYTLTDQNELHMDVRAHSDADTYVNFTNHSYFNLAGNGSGPVLDHRLWLNSTEILEAGSDLCPTGRVLDVQGGAFDFTAEKPIGQDIGAEDPQIQTGGGYDHCFILQKQEAGTLSQAASVAEPKSGRRMWVYTTQPAVQVYTGNFLTDEMIGKGGAPLGYRGGFCLETQHYPSSPGHPEFPTTLLTAGDKFHEVTIWQFGWE